MGDGGLKIRRNVGNQREIGYRHEFRKDREIRACPLFRGLA
jgi:hypothetical protein